MDIEPLKKAFGKDLDLFLFYVTWIKCGLNATKAYKELHPDVTTGSAEVLGSRLLGKVSKDLVMRAYGLDLQLYFEQLKDGVKAMKWNDFTGEREEDHKTRLPYHTKLGLHLGIEADKGINISDSKVMIIPSDLVGKYAISHNAEPSS